ncbi:terminase [Acinetobacter sp. NyZ410]|uniref:terminase n=1 Tax=Acinetobacter sp. NyZ410 TaxID=2929509 RepID=UPI001FBA5B5E|nr:terminase [Acinetobacter sp. NyZ410]UOH16922.1 terminase [Acinetobacter sp. NyZ410]UOH17565.1 terminase [Acinetobacter sp. NyZ410]
MTPDELEKLLSDPWQRLTSGFLYQILIKGDEDTEGLKAPFMPNEHQLDFMNNLWYRNIILKARQLGFTTLIAIYYLDCCLFGEGNIRAGMVAQDRDSAEKLFRDKVKFAYDNLPPEIKERFPLARDSASELLFAHNNSSIKVGTSMRSGTLQYLHVSEYGKICAQYPKKAKEVKTGSIPAVSPNGIVIIESTAEGDHGDFFDMTEIARNKKDSGKELSKKDYKFNFYPWHGAKEYQLDHQNIHITDKEHEYFDGIEQECNVKITLDQRAWYVATRDSDFSGSSELMWQEYPSTPDEAFKKSKEGCWYTEQFLKVRKEGRICTLPIRTDVPVNTFWDIGNSDGTAIWFHQRVGMQDLFIDFAEGWGEPYEYFVKIMQSKGYLWGKHYLPHDGAHARQGESKNLSPQQMLKNLGLTNVEIVPRVSELLHGINQTRNALMNDVWFDVDRCKNGLTHIENYTRKFNAHAQTYTSEPVKSDGHSEASDAFRQFAQVRDQIGRVAKKSPPPPLAKRTTLS